MYRAFKFRLFPSKEQQIIINKIFGCFIFIYNYYLDRIKNNGYINPYSNISDYKIKYDNNTYITNAIYRAYKNNKYSDIKLDLGNKFIKFLQDKFFLTNKYDDIIDELY